MPFNHIFFAAYKFLIIPRRFSLFQMGNLNSILEDVAYCVSFNVMLEFLVIKNQIVRLQSEPSKSFVNSKR